MHSQFWVGYLLGLFSSPLLILAGVYLFAAVLREPGISYKADRE